MILVFVGAGGSAAVDPEQYPTTIKFFERLPEDIIGEPSFIHIHEFLQTQREAGQPIDIEEVLWSLVELQDYFRWSLDTNRIAGWTMERNRLHRFDNSVDTHQFWKRTSRFRSPFTELIDRINALVHELYAKRPTDDQLIDWAFLLQQLQKLHPTVNIFTTNYDRVLEDVVGKGDMLHRIETGRKSDGTQLSLDTTLWDKPGSIHSPGKLTKLHGSVDWQRSGNAIVIGSEVFIGNPKNHSILYPGFKGEPKDEPFIKFHEYLREVVHRTKAAIFIGFAFRDEYINTILSELPPEVPKYVINKDNSLPALSFLRSCKHFKTGFTRETIEHCIESIGKQEDLLAIRHAIQDARHKSKEPTKAETRPPYG